MLDEIKAGGYGGDDGGMRYSPANQITPANVDYLIPIWTYHTGDIAKRDCAVRYKRNGRVLAVVSIYRDAESLLAEAAMEHEAA